MWCAAMPDELPVTLVCGCVVLWPIRSEEPPACEAHGETRVRAVTAPKPRFTVKEN